MKKSQLFFVFACFLFVVFGFQNCSAPLPEEETGLSSTGGNGPGTSSKYQFAFDTVVDQVAYMSCHQLGTSFDKSSYFTFRVGAYQPGNGVGLNNTFLNQIAAYSSAMKHEAISSAINAGAQPLLSIRDRANAQTLYIDGLHTTPTEKIDHATMFMNLTDGLVADQFLSNAKLRYNRNGTTAVGARIEGDLNLNFGIDGLYDVQNALAQGGLLAVNYPAKVSNPALVRAPAHYFTNVPISTSTTQVYGRGLKVAFKKHPSATYANAPSFVLATIGEEKMDLPLGDPGRTVASGFNCPSNLIFKIADRRYMTTNAANTDTSKIYCEMKPDDPASLSSTDRELLRRARLSLRTEDWWIDWTRKCIVPKKFDSSTGGSTQCYGNTATPVEFDLTKACVDSPTTTAVRACAAFASICIR